MMIDVYDLLELAEQVGYDCNVYIAPCSYRGANTLGIKIEAKIGDEIRGVQEVFFQKVYQNTQQLKDHIKFFGEYAKHFFKECEDEL